MTTDKNYCLIIHFEDGSRDAEIFDEEKSAQDRYDALKDTHDCLLYVRADRMTPEQELLLDDLDQLIPIPPKLSETEWNLKFAAFRESIKRLIAERDALLTDNQKLRLLVPPYTMLLDTANDLRDKLAAAEERLDAIVEHEWILDAGNRFYVLTRNNQKVSEGNSIGEAIDAAIAAQGKD